MRRGVLPSVLLVTIIAVASISGAMNTPCPTDSGNGVGRTGTTEADAGHRSYGQYTCKDIPNSPHCLRAKRGILSDVEEQPGEHGGRREKRSVLGGNGNAAGPSLQLMRVLTSRVLGHKIPVFFHDSKFPAKDLLREFFAKDHSPAVVVDLSEDDLLKADWLRSYHDECFVHVVLFSSVEVVLAFAEGVPDLSWTPAFLLLLNLNTSEDADHLLPHRALNHSPFLTLLQARVTRGAFRFDVHTYNVFGDKIDYIGHAYPDFSQLRFGDVFPDRFDSFHGVNLHLASWVDDFPYLVPQDALEETTGIGIYMLQEIGSRLNFTYTVYEMPEDQWWGDFSNGSWRGMIGELWRGEKDLCVNVMTIVEERYHAVDFSVPYFTDSFSFVLRNPVPPPRWWTIFFPFSWYTWLAVGLSLIGVSTFFGLLLKVKDAEMSWGWAVLEVVRVLLRQNSMSFSTDFSVRIFMGVWWLQAMIISISYTGNLVAYITVPARPHYIATVDELARSDLIPSMIDYGNFVPGALKESQDPTFSTLGQKLQLIPSIDYPLGFKQVTEGTHAFLEGTEFFNYLVLLHKVPNYYFLREPIYPMYVGWIYPKKTPWKHKFDKYLQVFVESGLCRYWKKVLVADLKRKMDVKEQAAYTRVARPLSLRDFQGTFVIYGLGILTALVTGLAEVLLPLHSS